MLATGAGAAAITGLVLPGLWWAQLLVFVVVSYLTLFLLRPTLLRRVRNLPGYQDSVQALVGSTGLATEAITATGGAVKVDGQVWSARSYDPNVTIEAGQHVDVFERDGIVLRVYPSDRPLEIEER